MIKRALLIVAVLGAAMFASSGSVAEAGHCYRGGRGFYGAHPGYYRSARYYGPPARAYYPGYRSAYYGGGPRYYGGSGVFFSIGF